MSAAEYSLHGPVAVIQLNSPPVNALSSKLRRDLYDSIRRAKDDPRAKCVVLVGKGRGFCAGADIKSFEQFHDVKAQFERQNLTSGTAQSVLTDPVVSLVDIVRALEDLDKPVIAAIHSYAYGGGLEVALGCHYRIAEETAKVGFPEVTIGILPAAEGTQRLPRLIGVSAALEIIAYGLPVPADQALEYGILDKVVNGDIMNEGIKFAMSVMSAPVHNRRIKQMTVKSVGNLDQLFEAATASIQKKCKGFNAPLYCLRSIRNSVTLPFEEGCDRERDMLMELVGSTQARALRHVFFAQTTISRWRLPSGASYKTAVPQPIKLGAVIGGGTMGSGIVMAMLSAGMSVILIEQNQQHLNNAMKMIESLLEGSVRVKKLTAEQVRKQLNNLTPSTNYEDLSSVDLVIEAVFEDMNLKKEVFKKLDRVCKPTAILCTNTSTLSIDEIASATSRPEHVVGTHFFVPAYHMKLLENVYGKKTSPNTIATVMKLGSSMNKLPVLVKTCDGFVGNRMWKPLLTECESLVEEGCLPHEVDAVMEDFGFVAGAFKVRDISGLDVAYRLTKEMEKRYGATLTPQSPYINGEHVNSMVIQLHERGRTGRRYGKGWYRYATPGAREPIVDQEVTDLIYAQSKAKGITRRKISRQEILERLLYSLINEGFHILGENIADKPQDIDIIWLHAYGWPRFTGGPMFYANEIGLDQVYKQICYYHEKYPDRYHWLPSDLLGRLSQQKKSGMDQWMTQQSQSRL